MKINKDHLILFDSNIKEALNRLNALSEDAVLFLVNYENILVGSLTDGDIRRGLLSGFNLQSVIKEVCQKKPKHIIKGQNNLKKIIEYRKNNFRIIPVVDSNKKVINVINFRKIRSYLPLDAIIMAGGRGERLKPLTDNTPKPLLQIGGKAIMEYNLDRLALYGIDDFWITLNYLGEHIENYFGDGNKKSIKIKYVWEKKSLGTIGGVSLIDNFQHDNVLITNSDLLTNINYEQFFLEFISKKADLAVLSIPYQVNIPYAVLQTDNGDIKSLNEKPNYTYYSNGGVYLLKKEVLKYIPKNKFFNATDLVEELIKQQLKVISIPFSGYWLDIGKHKDFEKAQFDLKNIMF
jgi:dTDP-glucose pyrophosphorylase